MEIKRIETIVPRKIIHNALLVVIHESPIEGEGKQLKTWRCTVEERDAMMKEYKETKHLTTPWGEKYAPTSVDAYVLVDSAIKQVSARMEDLGDE
jgi:hypothetical protein